MSNPSSAMDVADDENDSQVKDEDAEIEVAVGESQKNSLESKEDCCGVFQLSLEELRKRLPVELSSVAEFAVPSSVQETFEKFCAIHSKGRRLNDDIRKNKRISNPYFVANTLQRYGIDQGASDVLSSKRQRMIENAETDDIQAFRQYRKQHKQSISQMDAREEASRKQRGNEGGMIASSHMTAMQQEAISQFVMEAKQRLRPLRESGLSQRNPPSSGQ